MKNIFLLFFSLLSLSSFSQAIIIEDSGINKSIMDISENPWLNNTPGQELKLYTKHHNTGLILSLAGSSLLLYGNILNERFRANNPNINNYNNNTTVSPGGIYVVGVGILTSIIGTVFILEAPVHIKRAGIILDQRGVGISVKL